MVKVKIDGVECDFEADDTLVLSYSSEDLVNLESGRTGRRIQFKMPLNAQNSEVFGIVGDVHPLTKFNEQWHAMTIEADGIELFSGTAYLMGVLWQESTRYMVVECGGGVIDWADTAATTLFKNINMSFSMRLTTDNIKASWASDSNVKFFPIVRDSYEVEGSSTDMTGVRILSSIDDYHPFIRLSSLIEAIFKADGYSVESETALKEEFDEIYISGNYTSADGSSAAEEAMGFYAKKLEDVSTLTDDMGRVSMSPYDPVTTVGNIVDIESIESDYECYNHGNCLQINNLALVYTPLTQICVGFEYYLHYSCDCTIASRSAMKGINIFNTIDNDYVEWEITNRYMDQRESVVKNINYKVVIFDFVEGETFRLYGTDESGNFTLISSSITERMTSVLLTSAYTNLQLYRLNGTSYSTYPDDWALYFGYVEETTFAEVKVTIRTAAKDYSPSSPMKFESQLLEGAERWVNFTLHKDSSLRPYFTEYPAYNATLSFEDIGQHSFSALDLLSSVQHLYNLRISTNESARSVTIESFDNFYSGETYDWSSKLIEGQEIEFVDYAQNTHRQTTYGYQQTDGVVQRLEQSDNLYFGEWTASVDSYVAASSRQTLLNPMLSASTNDEDGVMVVGDRDDVSTVSSLSFSPRIGRYLDTLEVDYENYSIPYVAFHAPEYGFTLCFENRDGVEGLNRFYTSQVELFQRAQLVSLSLQITALDYINLVEPNDVAPSIRSTFKFSLNGESFKTILYSIESYNPISGVAKCLFLTID